jgi:hypothetical protein
LNPKTQQGGAAAWLLWGLFVMTALVVLIALGLWHAMEALDALGPLRVIVDGRDVLDGVRWSDFHDGERISFVLLAGFALLVLLLALLLVLPLVFIGVMVIPVLVTLVVVAVSLVPIVLPVLLIVWLVRRSRRTAGATMTP